MDAMGFSEGDLLLQVINNQSISANKWQKIHVTLFITQSQHSECLPVSRYLYRAVKADERLLKVIKKKKIEEVTTRQFVQALFMKERSRLATPNKATSSRLHSHHQEGVGGKWYRLTASRSFKRPYRVNFYHNILISLWGATLSQNGLTSQLSALSHLLLPEDFHSLTRSECSLPQRLTYPCVYFPARLSMALSWWSLRRVTSSTLLQPFRITWASIRWETLDHPLVLTTV